MCNNYDILFHPALIATTMCLVQPEVKGSMGE